MFNFNCDTLLNHAFSSLCHNAFRAPRCCFLKVIPLFVCSFCDLVFPLASLLYLIKLEWMVREALYIVWFWSAVVWEYCFVTKNIFFWWTFSLKQLNQNVINILLYLCFKQLSCPFKNNPFSLESYLLHFFLWYKNVVISNSSKKVCSIICLLCLAFT